MALKKKRRTHNDFMVPKVAIEHTAFYGYLQRYHEALNVRGYSPKTVHIRDSDIRRFIGWCDERGLHQPQDITKPILERYQTHLYYYRRPNGTPLAPSTRASYLISIKQFFKWLTQENYLLYNPASELILPKGAQRLPVVLSVEEVERLLHTPDTEHPSGLRDRAILEVLYSTGMRRLELCQLQLRDVHLEQHTVKVMGKGKKERLLPLGERASVWLHRYLDTVRPQLLLDVHEPTLFLNDYGEAFRDTKLGDKVKRYLKRAGLEVSGSCHLLSHAMATHMLENGAELRFIQALLGHASFESTQLYTHVSLRKLQAIHAQTHPAKLDDRQALGELLSAEADD